MRTLPLSFLAACVLVACLPAGPAHAHAILMGSDPAVNATVAPGPARVVLRFNSRIDQGRSRLELRGPGGAAKPLPLRPPAHPEELAADVTLPPGAAVLRWQVLAVDGHLTRGDVPFTVAPPPPVQKVP